LFAWSHRGFPGGSRPGEQRPGRATRSGEQRGIAVHREIRGYFLIMTKTTSTTRLAVTILGATCALVIPATAASADTAVSASPGKYFVQSLGDRAKCLTLDGLEAATVSCATGATLNLDGTSAIGFRVNQLVASNPSCLTRAVPDAAQVGAMADMCGADHQFFQITSKDNKSYTITAPDTNQTLQSDAHRELHFAAASNGANEQWVLVPVTG
jgi:hypothetical protein